MNNFRTFLLLITLSLLSHNLIAQQKCADKSDLYYEGFNGKVKKVRVKEGSCKDWNFEKCDVYSEKIIVYDPTGSFLSSETYLISMLGRKLQSSKKRISTVPRVVKDDSGALGSIIDTIRWIGNVKEEHLVLPDMRELNCYTLSYYDDNCNCTYIRGYHVGKNGDIAATVMEDINILPVATVNAMKQHGSRYKFFGDPKVKVLTTDAQGNPLKMLNADGDEALYEYEYYP